MKTFLHIAYIGILASLCVMPFAVPGAQPAVHAAEPGGYTPLVPIEGLTTTKNCDSLSVTERIADSGCKTNLGSFIPGLVKLAIQLAGALAVIMIVIGGVQYASSDAISGKSEGRDRIQNAIYGLLLAIGAFFILNTINPKTLELDLNIRRPTVPGAVVQEPFVSPLPDTQGNLSGTPWPPTGTSPTDASVRERFSKEGISVNKANCTKIGQSDCTSLDGLSSGAINGLLTLARLCKTNFSCGGRSTAQIVITGGTEYWGHSQGTAHRPGGGAIDLRKTEGLDVVIKGVGGKNMISGNGGCSKGVSYRITNGGPVYTDEIIAGNPPHWHICY